MDTSNNRYLDVRLYDALMWGNTREINQLINSDVSCSADQPVLVGRDKNGEPMEGISSPQAGATLLHVIARIAMPDIFSSDTINDFHKIAKRALDKGVNINAQDVDGNTALHKACSVGNAGFVKFLCEQGANITIQNNYHETSIAIAKNRCQEEIVSYLEKSKINATCILPSNGIAKGKNGSRAYE